MKALMVIVRWFRARLTSYSFNSDYLAEQAVIQRMFDRYVGKMNGAGHRRYLWRAICQYRCQAFARKPWCNWLANVVALAGLPLVLLLVRRSRNRPRKTSCKYLKIDNHAACQVPPDIKTFTLEANLTERYLQLADLRFALALFFGGGILYPELLLKFIFWVASIRPYLDRYRFEYLVQYCEYSAHSSLRKAYLNSQGVKIANVTHGEEFISCRSAFSSFDQYHAWELTPQSIHDAMHMECGERFSFNPCASIPPAPKSDRESVLGFLWPSIEGPDLNLLVGQLNRLGRRYKVIVRPHPNPNYANNFGAYRTLLLGEVSDPHTETIHSFIDRTGLVVGYLSAVLVQAMLRGRSVLYVKDEYLASLVKYHDYYKQVPAVSLEDLSSYLSAPALPKEAV